MARYNDKSAFICIFSESFMKVKYPLPSEASSLSKIWSHSSPTPTEWTLILLGMFFNKVKILSMSISCYPSAVNKNILPSVEEVLVKRSRPVYRGLRMLAWPALGLNQILSIYILASDMVSSQAVQIPDLFSWAPNLVWTSRTEPKLMIENLEPSDRHLI